MRRSGPALQGGCFGEHRQALRKAVRQFGTPAIILSDSRSYFTGAMTRGRRERKEGRAPEILVDAHSV